jgi:hypothetical protein
MNYKLDYVQGDDKTTIGVNNLDTVLTMLRANVMIRAGQIAKANGVPPAMRTRALERIKDIKTAVLSVDVDTGIVFINNERPENSYYQLTEV